MFPTNIKHRRMSTNTSNRTITWTATTSTLSSPASQCIPWIIVLGTESLAIVVLNIITIIVFVKQRHLQRQSLYLIIHLAIVDLLAGAISGPMVIEYFGSARCGLWEYSYSPLKYGLSRLFSLFPAASFFNLAAISLERMHATLRPFKHRFVKKRVYHVITTVIWLTAIIREIVIFIVFHKTRTSDVFVSFILYEASWLISLLIICVSFVSIFIKIRFGPHPNRLRNSVINRERRLTSVLFVVLSVSLLTTLPWIIFECFDIFHPELLYSLSLSSLICMEATAKLLVFANSLINPIFYAIRMPEFRAGLAAMFHRTPNQVNALQPFYLCTVVSSASIPERNSLQV